MAGPKKTDSVFENPVSTKVQDSFDAAFSGIRKNNATEDNQMSNTNQKGTSPKIDFDQDEALELKSDKDFTLDFEYNEELESEGIVATQAESLADADTEGFSLEGIETIDLDLQNATQKTIVFDAKAFAKELSVAPVSEEDEMLMEMEEVKEQSLGTTADLMTREETKANIESTIKDILRPKFDSTKEIDLEALTKESAEVESASDLEDTVLDFSHTPSEGFLLTDILGDDEIEAPAQLAKTGHTGEFDISSDDLASFAKVDEDKSEVTTEIVEEQLFEESDDDHIDDFFGIDDSKNSSPAKLAEETYIDTYKDSHQSSRDSYKEEPYKTSAGLGTEDSIRYQATIRQLREEREDILGQVKTLKGENRELEQDNLSLKASLDEAKIEISILRKRHMVELEDMKYRLTISEEKKALADERARQADLRREKLEQKVRIDFNQVKQREKELESKLEMLSMDVDSQVQSRDQKILELRRKIDALEFNMENTTIKEQKSLDDKRKLEDRLNKIMKTLRNSIKNLEDDIDLVQDDDQNADKN
jgi:hypothetical protein